MNGGAAQRRTPVSAHSGQNRTGIPESVRIGGEPEDGDARVVRPHLSVKDGRP